MAALTASRATDTKGVDHRSAHAMTASQTIYHGGAVMIVAGLARAAASVANATFVAGVAAGDTTSAASGTTYVTCLEGRFRFAGSGLAATDKGKMVWFADDQTISLTNTGNLPVGGIILEVISATEAWIHIAYDTNAALYAALVAAAA
jgi:hypothetical protein